jgi:hypothetical protein
MRIKEKNMSYVIWYVIGTYCFGFFVFAFHVYTSYGGPLPKPFSYVKLEEGPPMIPYWVAGLLIWLFSPIMVPWYILQFARVNIRTGGR